MTLGATVQVLDQSTHADPLLPVRKLAAGKPSKQSWQTIWRLVHEWADTIDERPGQAKIWTRSDMLFRDQDLLATLKRWPVNMRVVPEWALLHVLGDQTDEVPYRTNRYNGRIIEQCSVLNHCNGQGGAVIATMERFPLGYKGIRHLKIRRGLTTDNRSKADSIEVLSGLPCFGLLTKLDLAANGIGDEDCRVLIDGFNAKVSPAIKVLDLRQNNLRDAKASGLLGLRAKLQKLLLGANSFLPEQRALIEEVYGERATF